MTGNDNNFPWIELAAALPGGGFRRNQWVRVEDLDAIKAWRDRHGNKDVYASVCRFERPDRSSAMVCPFFADFDADEPGQAVGDVITACQLLRDRAGVHPDCVELFFSGAKGFHLVVPRVVFGSPAPPEALQIWRALAQRLAQAGVGHLDLGIYDRARVLRLANSINTKTGLCKIPLEYKELRDLGMDHVLEQAQRRRDADSLAVAEECPRAVHWFSRALASVRRGRTRRPDRPQKQWGFQQGWRMPPCICRLEQATLPDGLRHNAYFVLARFYAWVNMHRAEAERRLREIDRRNPIRDPDYLRRVVDCGRKHAGFAGCEHSVLEAYCDRQQCFVAQMRNERAQRRRDGRIQPNSSKDTGGGRWAS